MVKNLPAMQETPVRSLSQEDCLEKEMATHSSILAWSIPWTKEPGELQSLGSQRVRHNYGVLPPHFEYVAESEWLSRLLQVSQVMGAEIPQDREQLVNDATEVRCDQVTPEHSWLSQQQLEQKSEPRGYEARRTYPYNNFHRPFVISTHLENKFH